MRFGQVGFGSMGKRRTRDLMADGHDVVVFDVRSDRVAEAREEFGLRTADSLDHLIAERLDALILSTPPDTHETLIAASFDAAVPFFVEASIEVPSPDWVVEQERVRGIRGVPSATWRFHPASQRLRELVRREEVLSVHHLYAGYLPAWHPYEHYSEFYAGRELATCAAREMVPFELDLLTWLFGPVAGVRADRRRAQEWTTDIIDSYVLELEFRDGGYGTLAVELHQPDTARVTRVGTSGGAYVADYGAGTFRQPAGDGRRADGRFDTSWESVYRDEIRCFVAALAGEPYPKTWTEDRHLYDVLAAAEQSALSECVVPVGATGLR